MSGTPVIIDPGELRQFAAQLKRFNTELGSSSRKLSAQFRHLGETWRDPAYQRFTQEFEQTMRHLNRFQMISNEVIPLLPRKAQRAEEVHRG